MPGTHPADRSCPPDAPRRHAGGTVVSLKDRRRKERDEVVVMGVPSNDPLPSEAQIHLAHTLQALFLHRGQSLVDPETAEAYRTTLEAVRLILEGALVTGVVDEQQHADLRGMVDHAETVPDIL